MNGKKDPLEFSGRGFSKDDFTDEERAEMRERAHHYDRHFLSVDEFLRQTGLKWLADVAKGVGPFLKAFAAASTILGAILAYAAAKQAGYL